MDLEKDRSLHESSAQLTKPSQPGHTMLPIITSAE